jgi:hypothetical protein
VFLCPSLYDATVPYFSVHADEWPADSRRSLHVRYDHIYGQLALDRNS